MAKLERIAKDGSSREDVADLFASDDGLSLIHIYLIIVLNAPLEHHNKKLTIEQK